MSKPKEIKNIWYTKHLDDLVIKVIIKNKCKILFVNRYTGHAGYEDDNGTFTLDNHCDYKNISWQKVGTTLHSIIKKEITKIKLTNKGD